MAAYTPASSKNIWGFDPTSIGGCTLWLDGADKNTMFSDIAGTTPSTTGGNVVRWNDKSISKVSAIINNNVNSYNTIYATSPPTLGADRNSGRSVLNFGVGIITLTATTATTNIVTVTNSSFNLSAGQHLYVGSSVGGLGVGAAYYVYNPSGTPTTSFQLVSTPSSTTPVTLTTTTSQSIPVVISSAPLILPFGSHTVSIPINTTTSTLTVVYPPTASAPVNYMLPAVGQTVNFTSSGSITGINTTIAYFITSVSGTVGTSLTFTVSTTPGGTNSTFTLGGTASTAGVSIGRGTFSTAQQDCTMFVVARTLHTNISINSTVFSYGTYAGYAVRAVNLGGDLSQIGNGTSSVTTFVGGAQSNLNITSGTFNNSIQSGWLNGIPYNSTNLFDLQRNGGNWQTGTTVASVGAFLPVYPMYGYIAEILYYNTALSNADRQNIEGYLAWKWNLQNSLPTSHPYYNNGITHSFVPPSLAHCSLWLDASDMSTLYTSESGVLTTPAVNNGDLVGTWVDKSGFNNYAYATGAGIIPQLNLNAINGRSTIRTSNGQFMSLVIGAADRLPIDANAGTYFTVSRTVTTPSNQQVIFGYGTLDSNPNRNRMRQVFYSSTNTLAFDTTQSNRVTDATVLSNTVVMMSATQNSTTTSGWRNGNPFSGGTVATSETMQIGTGGTKIGTIGAGYDYTTDVRNDFFEGDLAEIIVFNIVLSTAQRQQVEGYLAWKWGIQASLPSTHPYALANYFYTVTRPFSRNFVPTDISNCIMWYDGADLRSMFRDTAGTTPVTGTGNAVRLWRDKSGMGNNLTSDAADNSPILTTSTNPQKFDMVFDGNDYLSNTALVNNSNTYTKFLVFYRTDGTPTNQFQRLFSYASTTGDFSAADPTGINVQTAGAQTSMLMYKSNTTGAGFTIATNTYYIMTIVATPLNMSLFLNGSLTASTSFALPTTNFNATTFRLGTNFGALSNGGWLGRINEVISYNRQLSITEYQEVEGYLAWKWGLRNSLPTNHPFYKFPTPSLTPFQPELQLYKDTFDPSDLSPDIWFDPQDRSTMGIDTNGRIVQWKNKGTATSCSFLSIPSFASRSLNATETNSNALTVSGPLLSTTTSTNTLADYLDFSTGSYPITAASVSGTTMTITLGAPTTVTVVGGSIAAFSLQTVRGTNTTTLATIYFSIEQLVPPFSVGSSIVVAGTVNSSATVLNGTWTVVSCTPFYVTFALVGATAGSLTTQGTIRSSTLVNIATVNYTTTATKQPFIAGQSIATISGMTPNGLNGTTPTILSASSNQFQFLTSVATGTISSAGTITNAVVPHNIPSGRQIAVGFANGSTFSGGASTNTYFLIDTVDSLGNQFTGRGTYYIVNSVPAPNTLTITLPSGVAAGALNIVAGRVDYGEILSSNAGANLGGVSAPYVNSTTGVNNANTLFSTGNTSTSATVTFTPSSRYYNQSFVAGDTIIISGVTSQTAYNGAWYVTAGTSTSVTFETTTTLPNITSAAGSLFRVQQIMPSGCYGIRSISVTGTTATVSYNNFGVAINQYANGNPFKVGHAIYIAGTTATGGTPGIFNGTFTVTRESNDSGAIGTVQFSIASADGLAATTGTICRGSGGTAGLSGAFLTTSCTINETNVVVNFAKQPIIPFVVGQQIRIVGTVSTGTDINGIRTVTAATTGSVTFDITAGTGTITTQGTISAGMLVVTSGTYSSPTLTLNFSPSLSSAFPIGTWVAVYGVLPAVNNGYWQVTGGSTSSVQFSVPGGSGPITNATGTVSFALQLSCGTMTQHGLSPGDVVTSLSQYSFFTAGSNYPGVTGIPYTIIATPSPYRYTVLPRSNYYVDSISGQGFSTSVGPVYVNESASIIFFPIVGYCLENTRSQASSGIFNSTNATMFYMSHFYMNSMKTAEGPQGTLFATSTTVNGNASNSLASLGIYYLYASAPRYILFRNGQSMRGPSQSAYFQTTSFLGSNLNSFRPAVVACNFTTNTVNDMPPQTLALSLLGTRLDNNFRSSTNNGNAAIQVSNQTGIVVNATWASSVATLTLILNSANYFLVGNSITVQSITPTGFNGTFTVTGSSTGATSGALTYTGWTVNTITYALASNPGTYTAGTGSVLLNTTTSLSTNHIRIGAATQATSAFDINSFHNMFHYYTQGIGEIIAFNRILTTEERQLLEGWASQKYNSQLYLAQNQSAVKVDTTFRVTQAAYTGSGPYVNTIVFTSTAANQFAFNTPLTISGCTEATALNGTWAVTNSTNTTATFFSPTIILPSANLAITSVTNVTGITIANTFIHPYRLNPVGISPSLDLTKTYAQGLAAWFDAANRSTIGFSSGNFVNSWTSAGGTLGMVLANTLSSSNWSNPTYTTDAASRPYLRFQRLQYACTTVSVDASNGILITSPNIVPAVDQSIVFNGTIPPLGNSTGYYIKTVTPVSGNNYTITVSSSVGGATATVTQNSNLVISPTINRQSTLKSTVTTFTMGQLTTQSSNNEYTNILVFSRDGTGSIGQFQGFTLSYTSNINNSRLMIEEGGRRCDYNLNGSLITTQPITYGSATLASNIPYILINYRRGSTNFTRLIGNNTIVTTTANNSQNLALITGGVSLRIGAYDQPDATYSNAFSGGIYEHMLFKYALTDQAIFQIEAYLAWKWGLQTALPTTHPYYKLRP